MTTKAWLAAALVAAAVVYGARGCRPDAARAPDEKLAHELTEMCDLARANLETPERGVRRLGHYLASHNLVGELSSTVILIEQIENDRAHDARARLARKRLAASLQACERDWMKFAEAVEDDPEARALVDRFGVRLNRTLEILFGSQALDLQLDVRRNLRQLPGQLGRALGATLPSPQE